MPSLQSPETAAPAAPGRVDLFEKFPWLKSLAVKRAATFWPVWFNLAVFWLLMMAAAIGHPVGNQNISIMFIWILWWFALITFLVPFGGRVFCMVCPFPAVGEWIQRGSIFYHRIAEPIGLNKRWPARFKNIWLQVFGFMMLAWFSPLLVTRPLATLISIGGIWALCTVLMLIYERRAFCVYLCPVSGFQGLYALLSPVEVRPRVKDLCGTHKGKHGCYFGVCAGDGYALGGYACPWLRQPEKLDRNAYCGMCFECVRSCQRDNMTLNLRPFGSDIIIKSPDEAWKAFMMLVLAAVYTIELLGPYGILKDWANATWTGQWGGWAILAAASTLSCLVVFPAVFAAFAWLSWKLAAAPEVSFKDAFVRFSYVTVPMGLMAWIAFSVPLMMINGSYILEVASNPFGWGWDLFGTAHIPWTPVLPQLVPYLQSILLLAGLVWSTSKGYDVAGTLFKDSKARLRSVVPIGALLLLVTLGFLKLFTS